LRRETPAKGIEKSNEPLTAGGRELGLEARPPARSIALLGSITVQNHPLDFQKRLKKKGASALATGTAISDVVGAE
jgi:hypothetical protein